MASIAVLGSITQGICHAHNPPISVGGFVSSCSGDVICEGLGAARVGDTITSNCGHQGFITTGVPSVLVDGQIVAIADPNNGSMFDGDYVGMITSGGADNIQIG